MAVKFLLLAGVTTPGPSATSPMAHQPAVAAGGPEVAADAAGMACEMATAVLGRNGCGLTFGLYSELKPGMRWEYMLWSMSCNALGQPVKVHTPPPPPHPTPLPPPAGCEKIWKWEAHTHLNKVPIARRSN